MANKLVHAPQIKIPATYMRGGTSKGIFFCKHELPDAAKTPGDARDKCLLRVIGSPDPYGKQTDGMGGATSSTSKVVLLSKSEQVGHDVDYLFGQVAIDKALIDWSGNCGNLTAAVGAFTISRGLVDVERIPKNGIAVVRIWQENIKKSIVARVPMTNGEVQETGSFELDGVTFPAAEIKVEFIKPVDDKANLFPTGNLIDQLEVPNLGTLDATMLNAGIPIIFVNATDVGYVGTELQHDINSDESALTMFETIRAAGALKMGLIERIDEAKSRLHTPKVAFIGEAKSFIASSGKGVEGSEIDLNVRALSMGLLHHAMMGTASVAIATAGAIPGTLVQQLIRRKEDQTTANTVTFGHPSGTTTVEAKVELLDDVWSVRSVSMSRSARVLMEGWVRVPADAI